MRKSQRSWKKAKNYKFGLNPTALKLVIDSLQTSCFPL